MASCSSCIDLSVQVQDLKQAVGFASWLLHYGTLIRSLEFCGPERNPVYTAHMQDALALGLQACHSMGKLWQLKSFSSSFPCSHRMLRFLPANSLVSLRLAYSRMHYPGSVRFNMFCSALGQLQNLRDVSIKLPTSILSRPTQPLSLEHAERFLPGLSQLTALTRLALNHIEQETLCHARYLPTGLLQLQLDSVLHWGPREGLTCDVSHLTAVTSLDISKLLPGTSLPPYTRQLVKRNPAVAEDIAILSSSRARLESMRLVVQPSVGAHLSTLTALSTLTELELSARLGDGFGSMASAWRSLPMLRALVLTDIRAGNNHPPVHEILTPEVLSHLAATTSLTRLVFSCHNVEKIVRSEVSGWCQHIAQLHQLRHLHFDGDYALDSSAQHLTSLSELTYLDVSYCQVPDSVAVAFGGALKCLVKLNLSGNDELSDACAPSLAELTALTSLGLLYMPWFTEQGLQALSSLKKLKKLMVDKDDLDKGAVDRLWEAIRGSEEHWLGFSLQV